MGQTWSAPDNIDMMQGASIEREMVIVERKW